MQLRHVIILISIQILIPRNYLVNKLVRTLGQLINCVEFSD